MENKKYTLTIEELRATGKYDHLNDDEVQNIINTLYELSLILYDLYMKEHG